VAEASASESAVAEENADGAECFVLVEVLEFIPFRDVNADARAARTKVKLNSKSTQQTRTNIAA